MNCDTFDTLRCSVQVFMIYVITMIIAREYFLEQNHSNHNNHRNHSSDSERKKRLKIEKQTIE